MVRKEVVFHYLRWVFAAVPLWWDQRLFLFYAFTLGLSAFTHLDRLRAIVRVFQLANEARFKALGEKLDVTPSDFNRVREQETERIRQELSEKQWKSLEHDWRIVRL
jgi:hypothetical protein